MQHEIMVGQQEAQIKLYQWPNAGLPLGASGFPFKPNEGLSILISATGEMIMDDDTLETFPLLRRDLLKAIGVAAGSLTIPIALTEPATADHIVGRYFCEKTLNNGTVMMRDDLDAEDALRLDGRGGWKCYLVVTTPGGPVEPPGEEEPPIVIEPVE